MHLTYCLGGQYRCTCTSVDQVGKRSWKRKEISQFISILCDGFEKNILFLWNSRLLTATCKTSIYLSLICQYTFVDDTIVMFLFSSPWGGLEIVLCNIEARIVSGGRLWKMGDPTPPTSERPLRNVYQWFTNTEIWDYHPAIFRQSLMQCGGYQIFSFSLSAFFFY